MQAVISGDETGMKLLAGIFGIVLMMAGAGIFAASTAVGLNRIVALIIGLVVFGVGYTLLDWATGWSRRKKQRQAEKPPKYTPKGGGM
jgi:hypothetical protein